ncbi:MAG TPA: heme o synthase [Vicinamibacterales bacterium]|nr:heme o synthase [Vicinamibacterales bacterium]
MKQIEVEMSGGMPAELAVDRAGSRARLSDYLALTKPRLNFLVVATAAAGYYLGAADRFDVFTALNLVAGTALVAGGSSVFNQVYERDTDALMRRTWTRPLPEGRLQPTEALLFGGVLSTAGLLLLALGTTLLAAAIALVTLLTYTVIYTPMKRRSSLATLVGAIPGALPPMLGWAAGRDNLSIHAWTLFSIVFLWQLPHFLAIAWMYREDFARAGFPLLPVIEPDGRSTGRQAVLYAAALIPVSLIPWIIGLAGATYFAVALLLGSALLVLAARFALTRTLASARRLFFGSITYLPLLWTLMILNRVKL